MAPCPWGPWPRIILSHQMSGGKISNMQQTLLNPGPNKRLWAAQQLAIVGHDGAHNQRTSTTYCDTTQYNPLPVTEQHQDACAVLRTVTVLLPKWRQPCLLQFLRSVQCCTTASTVQTQPQTLTTTDASLPNQSHHPLIRPCCYN